jgi:IclR family KDG regulon transcriptional repressor
VKELASGSAESYREFQNVELDPNLIRGEMLRKAMRVLSLFSPSRRELGVVETAELLNVSKSTVSRWLSAMEAAGFLARDPATARYRVSMRLAALGELAKQSTSLQRLALPALERLTARTGETSDLVILVGGDGVNVEVVQSPRPIKAVGWVGRRLPLHATAAGKALLAWKPEAEIRRLLPTPLERFTGNTLTDMDALLRHLAEIRARGYSVAAAELEEDLAGIAAPVRDHTGEVVGVLTIGAPLSRVPPESFAGYAREVVAASDLVSAELGYAGPVPQLTA